MIQWTLRKQKGFGPKGTFGLETWYGWIGPRQWGQESPSAWLAKRKHSSRHSSCMNLRQHKRGRLGCSLGESRQTKHLVSRKDVKRAFARSGRCFLLTLGIRATMEEKKNYGCVLVWLGATSSITSPRQVKNQTNKGIRGSLNRISMVYVATSSITSPRQVNRPTNYAMSSELHRFE